MSQINQTNMQQPIGWTNPPPSKTSSETIGADILNMYLSALVKRKGTTLPSDIQDGEIWQHQVSDTDSEFYLWRTADGTNFGTHIITKVATNEELETGTQEELENLIVTAWQTKQIRTNLTAELLNKTNLDLGNISVIGKNEITNNLVLDESRRESNTITFTVPANGIVSNYTQSGANNLLHWTSNKKIQPIKKHYFANVADYAFWIVEKGEVLTRQPDNALTLIFTPFKGAN